jgi:hypothetical protein
MAPAKANFALGKRGAPWYNENCSVDILRL